jgi:hypothetical protein
MSDVCYVIASGPSLIGFDFDALPSGFRIGANRSAWLAKCDALCTVDRNFHNKERERIASFGENAHVALSNTYAAIPDVSYWFHVQGLEGFALTPRTLTGSNSGFAALNLAVQLGFKEIALLGFDMKWDADRSHFHEGYNQRRSVDRNLGVWAQAFDQTRPQIQRLGVRITNFVGPMGSRIRAYPTAPLADLL